MVEFALILMPLLLLVTGIIQFGIGLNFWLDMNRIANQGARFAAVNCGSQATPPQCTPSLQAWLVDQTLSRGNNPTVAICYESMTGTFGGSVSPTVGDPVTVRLKQPFTLVPLLNITVDLKASTTMRLEQRPSKGGLTSPPLGLCPTTW
jgi:Flp pilus assembly protein TadG